MPAPAPVRILVHVIRALQLPLELYNGTGSIPRPTDTLYRPGCRALVATWLTVLGTVLRHHVRARVRGNRATSLGVHSLGPGVRAAVPVPQLYAAHGLRVEQREPLRGGLPRGDLPAAAVPRQLHQEGEHRVSG